MKPTERFRETLKHHPWIRSFLVIRTRCPECGESLLDPHWSYGRPYCQEPPELAGAMRLYEKRCEAIREITKWRLRYVWPAGAAALVLWFLV